MNPTVSVPISVSALFLIAICIPIFMIARLAKTHATPSKSRAVFIGILLFYFFYLYAVGVASIKGVFDVATLPPKIVQLTTMPLLLFLMLVISNTKTYKDLLSITPVQHLIKLHIFRLIGGFFIALLLLDTLPVSFALIAGLGDMITALSSIWVAKTIQKEKPQAKKIALIWNAFGLADILCTSTLAVLFTKWSMENGTPGVDILATFPFCFIPAFAPATIIFLHVSIFKKLLIKKFR